jgi:two-component system, OmpR family, sensor kinase
MISRLPVRLRLTLPFAFVMAVLLAVTGFVIYERVGSALLTGVDQSLRGQAGEAAQHVARGRSVLDRDAPGGPTVGQLVGTDGRVRETTPSGIPPLVFGPALRDVLAGKTRLRTGTIPGVDGDWRILAAPARAGGAPAAVVVAASLESREQALERLLREFLLGGSLALALATLAGYVLAASAFRPVEAMRRRAASIGASTPGARLPMPPARDELSRLAETLNGMLARLESAVEHERRFVDDASHELRTPLALLRTELELALRHPRSKRELERALRSAAEDADRLGRLAEDLLLVARYDQGRLPLRREPVEADELLGAVAGRFELRAQEAGRALRVDGARGLLLDGDEARLEQALDNLVENAFTYGAGTVSLSAVRDDGRVELHVTDEGAGVPPEFLPRAFDRFSRADEARGGSGGTGLGLAIVDLVARAHGGEARLANRPEGGADAWIIVAAVPSSL